METKKMLQDYIDDNLLDEEQKELAENVYEPLQVNILLDEGYDIQEALEKYEDVQTYGKMSYSDVAENMIDEGLFGDIPENLQRYIDTEAIGRDLSYDGYSEYEIGTEWGVAYIG